MMTVLGHLRLGHFIDGLAVGVAGGRVAFGDVADIEHGLRGQKVQALEDEQVVRRDVAEHQAHGLAVLEQIQRLFHDRQHGDGFLVLAGGALADLHDAALDAFEVGKHQLGFDGLRVGNGIDAAFDMGDVVVLEAAQHVDDGVNFADIGEELVAQAFALGRAAHEAGNVHEVDAGRDDFLRAGDAGDVVLARIGNRHFAGVRLDGAEGIIRGLRGRGLGQRVEKRRFADIGQADDAAFETHDLTCLDNIPLVWLCGIGLHSVKRRGPTNEG